MSCEDVRQEFEKIFPVTSGKASARVLYPNWALHIKEDGEQSRDARKSDQKVIQGQTAQHKLGDATSLYVTGGYQNRGRLISGRDDTVTSN